MHPGLREWQNSRKKNLAQSAMDSGESSPSKSAAAPRQVDQGLVVRKMQAALRPIDYMAGAENWDASGTYYTGGGYS